MPYRVVFGVGRHRGVKTLLKKECGQRRNRKWCKNNNTKRHRTDAISFDHPGSLSNGKSDLPTLEESCAQDGELCWRGGSLFEGELGLISEPVFVGQGRDALPAREMGVMHLMIEKVGFLRKLCSVHSKKNPLQFDSKRIAAGMDKLRKKI